MCRRLLPLVVLTALAGCDRVAMDETALRDPASCMGCHPDHTTAWMGSMHAHASDDPVFVAMNRHGQRATGGALGSLCVRCHAPMAVATGATTDGLDLDALPRELRGVTCVACHQVERVGELHNGDLAWADDGVMRGGLADPLPTPAHGSARSHLVETSRLESSATCGACHDVVLPGGLAIERTFAEWNESLFARPEVALSCAGCHMMGSDGPAARGGPVRRVHDHALPGVDLALIAWPEEVAQRAGIARDLAGTVTSRLCVQPGAGGLDVAVTLDNTQAGHAFPSGTTHARRVWVELVAETVGVETWVRGRFAPGEVVHRGDDPEVWVLGSRFLDAAGREVQMPWQATQLDSDLLAPSVTADRNDPRFYHAKTRHWVVPGAPDHVRVAVRMQPIGLDILDELIAAGELAPEVRAAMPTWELTGARLAWRASDGYGCTR